MWDDDSVAWIQIKAKGPDKPGVSIESWAPKDAYLIEVSFGGAALSEGKGSGGEGGENDTGFTGDALPKEKDSPTSYSHPTEVTKDLESDALSDDTIDELSDTMLDDSISEMMKAMGFTEDSDGEGDEGKQEEGNGNGKGSHRRDTDGKTGKRGDHRQEGSKDGKEFDGRSDPGSKVVDDTPGGDRDAPDGREMGEEGGHEGGVLGGGSFSILGFHVYIPPAFAGAVEVALILNDGDITGFGKSVVKDLLKDVAKKVLSKSSRRAGVILLRSQLRRQIVERSAQQMRKLNQEIKTALRATGSLSAEQKQLVKQWGNLSKEELARAQRVTYWEMQRRYFQETVKAAKQEAKKIQKGLSHLPNNPDLKARLSRVEDIVEAAEVQPIAGRMPIGHRYAGQQYPKDLLPRQYRVKGVFIDSQGFPEFESFAKQLPNGKLSVPIEYTGRREADFAAANAAAGLKETPMGYVWHHHQKLGVMMLIPEDLHDAVKHTGGVAVWKHINGVDYD